MRPGSVELAVHENVVFVLNGGGSGNEIVMFDPEGGSLGSYPGWYNWPIDMVIGGEGQILMSAIGARGDDDMLRFGMVLYNSSGDFFHGFHEQDTGLVRPYGLAHIQASDPALDSLVAVCDWDNNQTRFLQVDWAAGQILVMADPVIELAYPFSVATFKDRLVVSSMVCCEDFHDALIKVTLLNLEGEVLGELKLLETGETITNLGEVAFDPVGNILVVDHTLSKTLLFDPELTYLGWLDQLTTPTSIHFANGKVFTLVEIANAETGIPEAHVEVFTYSYN